MLRNDGYVVPRYYDDEAHKLIGKEPIKDRASARKREISPKQIEIFESQTGELLSFLGYKLVYGLQAQKVTGKIILVSSFRELLAELINRIKGLIRIHKTVK